MNFDFLPSIVASRSFHGELWMKKVTINVAFLKSHCDPKFGTWQWERERGKLSDINQKFYSLAGELGRWE
jgi:hypothetical protein